MFVRKKRLEELEKRVEALEKILSEVLGTRQAEPTEKAPQNEEATVAQVLDEWLNGKKEGGK